MKTLARCTVMAVRPGTKEDEYFLDWAIIMIMNKLFREQNCNETWFPLGL